MRASIVVPVFALLALLAASCSDESTPASAPEVGAGSGPGVATRQQPAVEGAETGAGPAVAWMGHWLHEDLRETLVREVAREYAFRHPEIRLDLRFPQEVLGVRSKPVVARHIAEMIQSGEIAWDIVWLDDHIYRHTAEILGDEDWGREHLVDFTTVAGYAESQKEFIVEDPVYRNQTGGILVGPYIEGYALALWYNREVAERLGLEIESRGMTFDDLLGHVRRVAEYNRTADRPVAAFYEARDWFTLEMLFQALVKSEIPDFREAIAEEGSSRKRAALLKGLQAFEALGRFDPLIPGHNGNTWFSSRHQVLEGEALFYVNGTWMYNHWRAIDPGKLELMLPVQLPVFQEVDHSVGGYIPTWAVMKNGARRDEAVDFLMWWSRPQVAERWVNYTKNPTGLRGHLDLATLGDDPYERFQAYITGQYGAKLHYSANAGYLLGKRNARLQESLNEELRRLLQGRTTALAAYESILAATR